MSKIFIKRPIFAIVIALMISLLGLLAMFSLPVARFPQITPPQVGVRTMYMGASADVVTNTVASVIEQQVMGVENMDYMVSNSSNDGFYSLSVVFKQGSNPDIDAVNVQNRVAKALKSLPKIVQDIGVTTDKSGGSMDMVFSLESPKATYNNIFLKNYGSNYLIPALKSIKGVGNVTEFGADYAMRIWLDPQKMALYKISVPQVLQAIQTQNMQGPAGAISTEPTPTSQQFQYSVSLNGGLTTPEQFGNIVLRKDESGNLLRLNQIARIELGANSYSVNVINQGIPSAGFAVSLTSDANALETIGAVKDLLEKTSKSFPTDMEYKVVIDSTNFVKASIKEVAETFIFALLLVLFIVYLFLQNWRATVIPMVAVPVSLLGTIAIFVPLGFSINTLTLFALVLSIGLVVDDAIVVIEAVEYEMKYNGKTPLEGAFIAMENVQGPVVAVAFVLSAVFIPVAFMGGITGVLYMQFALTIAISVLISAFVALSLTPALCGVMLRPHNDEEGNKNIVARVLHGFTTILERFILWYVKMLRRMTHHLVWAIVALVCFVGIGVFGFRTMPSEFVPPEDNGYFMVGANLPQGASINRTTAVLEKMQDYLLKDKDISGVFGVAGFDLFAGGTKSSGGILFISLKPWSERPGIAHSVFPKLGETYNFANENIPNATVYPINPPSIPGLGTSGGITMFLVNKENASVQNMVDVTQVFLAEVNKNPDFKSAITTFDNKTPAYDYRVNREKANRDGVSVASIYQALQGIYGQIQVNDFFAFGQNFKVIIEGDKQFRASTETMKDVYVPNDRGQMFPVSSYIDPKPTTVASTLTRFNNYPAVKLNINTAQGVSSGTAIKELEEIAAKTLPSGYSYDWGDQAREEIKAGNKSLFIFAMGFVFVFLILAALYESWTVPFSVLLSVPSGLVGASLLPLVMHMTNNIYVQIGLLTLIGLAAKNAILIVEYAKVRVEEQHKSFEDSAIEAAGIRVRPILMTSLAFIFGALPLIFSGGAGMLSRMSMGLTVVGGMLTATAFGIFIIPMLFIIVEKISAKQK